MLHQNAYHSLFRHASMGVRFQACRFLATWVSKRLD